MKTTETVEKKTTKPTTRETVNNKKNAKATPKEKTTDKEVKKLQIEKDQKEITNILQPNAKSRISKLETMNILAKKHEKVSAKYDELTNFIASNDGVNASMKFATESNYTFTVQNPQVINKILLVVEEELAQVLENTEKEVLEFKI